MRELVVTDHPDQEFTTLIAQQRCTFRFRWNVWDEAWSFDLKLGDTDVLFGRKVVLGVDLIKPFNFNIGVIFAVDTEDKGNVPNRTNLPLRIVRIFQHDGDYPAL